MMVKVNHAANLRRTAIGSVVVLVLVVLFAQDGGPTDMLAGQLAKVAKQPVAEASAEANEVPATAPTARPSPAAWFTPAEDEDQPAPPPPPPTRASDWGPASQVAGVDHPVVRKPPPRGVDFPENN